MKHIAKILPSTTFVINPQGGKELDLIKNNQKITERLKRKSGAGFTLIEIIVVIAIISILSTIILFSVTQYIDKSKDTNIMGNLAILVSAGEVFYNGNGSSYEGFCGSSVFVNAKNEIPQKGENCFDKICCNDLADEWVACAPLFFGTDKAYCVDSRGVKRQISSNNCTDSFVSGMSECPSE